MSVAGSINDLDVKRVFSFFFPCFFLPSESCEPKKKIEIAYHLTEHHIRPNYLQIQLRKTLKEAFNIGL